MTPSPLLLALLLLVAAPLPAQAPAPKPSIHLSWNANREPDVAYYRVWRSGGANGPWAIVKVVEHVRLTNRLSVRDWGVVAGKEYWYCISAVDGAGNESGKSEDVNGRTM